MTPLKQQILLVQFSIEHWYSPYSHHYPKSSVVYHKGPLLFLLFINDLPSLFGDRMTVKMFADDVKICLVVGDIDSSSVFAVWP